MGAATVSMQKARPPLWALGLAAVLAFTGRGTEQRKTGERRDFREAPQRRAVELDDSPDREETSAGQDDRGRTATHPGEIPAKGWKDIALRVYRGIGEDRILTIAAGVTYFTLLALFPGIAGLIALYGLYADAATISQHINTLAGVMPEGGLQIIREQVDRLASQPPQRLGIATFVGLAIALWSANGGMKALFDALTVVYHEKEKRSFIQLNAISLAFTFGAIAFVLLSVAAITILPVVVNYLGLSRVAELAIKIGRGPVLFVVVSFAIALLYRYGPSRDKPQWRWISPGSMFAAAAWLGASLLFSWYAENFGSYNETYGSLGAVIGFMTWLWLSTIVILIGAKINAELEHQTARDTTEGAPRPMGQRGAEMADTLGKAQS
jgi:membrane protein